MEKYGVFNPIPELLPTIFMYSSLHSLLNLKYIKETANYYSLKHLFQSVEILLSGASSIWLFIKKNFYKIFLKKEES